MKNNNVYIPENIVKGWVVQCPRDNNYVLAATFDFMKKKHLPLHTEDGMVERYSPTRTSRRFKWETYAEIESYHA